MDRLEREFTIEDLEEWTEYEVRVQAINGIGSGPWSQPVHGRTRESGENRYMRIRMRNTYIIMEVCFKCSIALPSYCSALQRSHQRVSFRHHLQQHPGALGGGPSD